MRTDPSIPAMEYLTKISTIILGWLGEKWKLRCELANSPENTPEKRREFTKCMQMWERRDEVIVLHSDRKLFGDEHEPKEQWSLDFLRAWSRTRELAIAEYKSYSPSRTQPTIRKWLRPTPKKRRDKPPNG